MKSTIPQERSFCGATTRQGGSCKRPPLAGRTRCRLHGGASLRGPQHPRWKGGEYAAPLRNLGLAGRYRRLVEDPHLQTLDSEIAVTILAGHEALSRGDWPAALDACRTKAQLIAADARRSKMLSLYVHIRDLLALVDRLVGSIQRHADPATASLITADLHRAFKDAADTQRGIRPRLRQ